LTQHTIDERIKCCLTILQDIHGPGLRSPGNYTDTWEAGQSPADVTAMADVVIGCHDGDVALSKQLFGDLPESFFWLALTVSRKSAPCSWSC
jgi:hypothetical protein